MLKFQLDFNPIKQSICRHIEKICQRNMHFDAVNDKTKNIYALKAKQGLSQKTALLNEIEQLKKMTDKTVVEATEVLLQVETKQKERKTSSMFFMTVVPHLQGKHTSEEGLSAVPEPLTSMTKNTTDTMRMRHLKQGYMRSEKVFHLTELIFQKLDQLEKEKQLVL